MQTQSPIATAAPALIPADPGKRIVAYLIDCVPFVLTIIPILGALLVLGYFLCRELLFDGRSFGKKVMGLRVVDAATGQRPDTGKLIIRNLVMFIPCFSLVELVVFLTNAEKRRFGDQWTQTMVVASDS